MKPIIIPSKHIYSINNSKVVDNAITKVEVSENALIRQYGNILSREYTFNFYSTTFDDNGYMVATPNWGSNASYDTINKEFSGVEFYVYQDTTDYSMVATATFDVEVDKITRIITNKEQTEITSHKLHSRKSISETQIKGVSGSMKLETNSYETNEELPLKIVSYDEERGIITLNYTKKIFWFIDENTWGVLISDTITIEGDYLDPSENVVSYGGGKTPFSMQTNELVQSSAYNYDWRSVSQANAFNILRSYGNGKETATLRCAISNYSEYYDDYAAIQIRINVIAVIYKGDGTVMSVTIKTDITLNTGDLLALDNGTILRVGVYDIKQGYYNSIATSAGQPEPTIGEHLAVVGDKYVEQVPWTLRIGDIVIPYVYGSNGKDKPMSQKKNGTPKEFKIVGKKMIYDGGVWQEIAVQEYERNRTAIITIIHISVPSMSHPYGLPYFTIQSGELMDGDVVEYDGSMALVSGFSIGSPYLITEKYITVFHQAVGQTITVEIK